MRTTNRDKQKLKYALYEGKKPSYKLDKDGNPIVAYVTAEGVEIYVETGEPKISYSNPVEFFASISFSGGEVVTAEFGLDVSNYDATLVLPKNSIEIAENSLIWHKSEVAYKDIGETEIEPKSADYRVIKPTPSLNYDKYLLERIVK